MRRAVKAVIITIGLICIPFLIGCNKAHFYVDPIDGRVWFEARECRKCPKELWVFYGDKFVRER